MLLITKNKLCWYYLQSQKFITKKFYYSQSLISKYSHKSQLGPTIGSVFACHVSKSCSYYGAESGFTSAIVLVMLFDMLHFIRFLLKNTLVSVKADNSDVQIF